MSYLSAYSRRKAYLYLWIGPEAEVDPRVKFHTIRRLRYRSRLFAAQLNAKRWDYRLGLALDRLLSR